MNFSRYQAGFLVVPGLIALTLIILAVASQSVRTATLPIAAAAFFGMFSMTVIPQTAHLLVSYPAYRNVRNLLYFSIGGIAALVPFSLFIAIVASAVVLTVTRLVQGSGA